jgi:hypothetical protein
MKEGWREFGWQGIRALIPSDWEIGAISGDHKSGYLRLDDPQMPRLELKWASHRKKPDLDALLDEYFKGLRKEQKKRGGRIRIKRGVDLIKDKHPFQNKEVTFFNWKSDRIRAIGMSWFCHDCRRTLIAQVNGFAGESIRNNAIRIFTSLEDHPTGHFNLWTAYQMSVQVPRRYRLESHKMMSAYLLFSFADGSRKIAVERYGLADVLLKSVSLEDWFRRTYAKDMKGYGFQIHTVSVDPIHEEISLEGRKLRFTDRIPLSALGILDLILRRRRMSARAWRCRGSNRIFVVRSIAKLDTSKIVQDIASSIRCHEG